MLRIVLSILLVAIGIFFIVKGSDFFVDSAIKVSRMLGVSELIIGATVVSIGTTLPELVTSITAIVMDRVTEGAGLTEIAIGNSFGSMCCNIGLVLSTAMIFGKVKTDKRILPKAALLLLATLSVVAIFIFGRLTIWHGVALFAIFVMFIAESIMSGKREMITIKATKIKLTPREKVKVVIGLIFGAVCVSFGAYITVENIETLCGVLSIPPQIIGATVVAVGTSLPELATTISAIRKGSTDIGIGNVIGANIVNSTLLLSAVAFLSGGVTVDIFTGQIGVYFLLSLTAIAIVPTIIRGKGSKVQGIIMAILYLALIATNTVFVI